MAKSLTVYAFDVDKTLTKINQPGVDTLDLEPNDKILNLALFFQRPSEGTLVITTARDEKSRELTEKWLKKMGLKPKHVLMRGHGDSRPDPEVKVEQINILRKNYGDNIIMYDDKEENCRAVEKETGVPCIRVKQ